MALPKPRELPVTNATFPDRSNGTDHDAVPSLVVDYLRGYVA